VTINIVLDLLDFLLKKSIWVISSMKGGEAFIPCRKYLKKMNLDLYLNDFHLELLAAFANENEFIGKEIIEPLLLLNKSFKLNYFNCEIRLSKDIVTEENVKLHNYFKNQLTLEGFSFKRTKEKFLENYLKKKIEELMPI